MDETTNGLTIPSSEIGNYFETIVDKDLENQAQILHKFSLFSIFV
jgi:hypothetical protein